MKTFAHILAAVAVVATQAFALTSNAAELAVDKAHSKVGFSVKHLMISNVAGEFKDFEGTFNFDPAKGTLSNSKFEVKAASIDTANAKRDEHLRSADFFDTAKYPTISITNSKIKKTGDNKYEWTGDLTMHGVTKPVKFALEHSPMIKGMMGESRMGFNASTTISRKEWGLSWNKALEAGGVAVSDEVKIQLDIEATEAKK